MERRDFLKAGVAAGGTMGLGAAGCGAALEGMSLVAVPSVAELQALDMDGFLKRLDGSLGFLQSTSTFDGIVPRDVQARSRKEPRFERSEELVRKTLRTALLAGSFGDLPEAGRVHPGVQERMWSSLQEMDDAVIGMNDLLTSLTPTERSDINRVMREDPTLGPRVLGVLDDEAVKAGVNDKRREHLREVGKHVCFRMRQSTSLLIDDYDDRVKKVSARDASFESVQRRMMAQMGEKAFWEYHSRQMALAQAWQSVPGIAQAAGPGAPVATGMSGAPPAPSASASPASTGQYVVYPFTPQPVAPPSSGKREDAEPERDEQGRIVKLYKKGTTLLKVGGLLFGLGALCGVIGALLVGTGGSLTSNGAVVIGAFVLTAAAGLGIAGIITLIVGGVYRARA